MKKPEQQFYCPQKYFERKNRCKFFFFFQRATLRTKNENQRTANTYRNCVQTGISSTATNRANIIPTCISRIVMSLRPSTAGDFSRWPARLHYLHHCRSTRARAPWSCSFERRRKCGRPASIWSRSGSARACSTPPTTTTRPTAVSPRRTAAATGRRRGPCPIRLRARR